MSRRRLRRCWLFVPQRNLFETQKTPRPSIETPVATPNIVCGMTIIPADPTIDPKMLRTPKADGVDYKLRTIDPPICNPAR